jgi:hypothetical protein
MKSRKIIVAVILMTALVIAWTLYFRLGGSNAVPAVETKPDRKESQVAATHKSRRAPTRPRSIAPGADEAADAEPRLQGEEGSLKLSSEDIEKFLQRNQRSADSLRTAYLAAHDVDYLKEAATNFPTNPKVQLSVLLQNVYPEERRKWLDAFKESSPENSLANYLSAREHINSGQVDEAIKELLEATRKPTFQDFTMDSIRALEELAQDTGLSPLEAHTAAMVGWASEHMTELAQLKDLTHGVVDLRKQYQTADDAQSVENLSQMATTLAGRLNSGGESKFMINQLVGISIEALSLGQLPPDMPFDFLAGKTPKERIDELRQRSEELKSLAREFQSAFVDMTESERITFSEKVRVEGEVEAARWLLQRR